MPNLISLGTRELCVFAGSFVDGRRVLFFGDASLGIEALLRSLGARSVHLLDPIAARAAHVPNASYHAPGASLSARDGAFDVVIVPNIGELEERASLLSEVRRVLGHSGIVCASSPEVSASRTSGPELDYYAFYDVVSLQFEHVRMFGTSAFQGLALAELGADGDPSVTVDGTLTEDEPGASAFVALASMRRFEVETLSVLRVDSRDDDSGASDSADHQAQLAAAMALKELTAQLDEERTRVAELDQQLQEARVRSTKDAEERLRGVGAERELAIARDRTRALEDQVRTLEARAKERSLEVERLSAEHSELHEKLAFAIAQGSTAAQALAAAQHAAEVPAPATTDDEVARLEELLLERATLAEEHRREIKKRDDIVTDLVRQLERKIEDMPAAVTPTAAVPPSTNGSRGEANAEQWQLEIARREGEIRASAWRIAELETELERLKTRG